MALFDRGGVTIGRIAGVPVRLHWTALVGAFAFNGFRFDAVRWLTFAGLVLIHELGHAFVVKAVNAKPTLIELTGYGGLCYWRGDPTPIGRAAIAWGGVWAQLLVLVGVEAYSRLQGWPFDPRILLTLTFSNAYMIAFNLLPLPWLDGAEAWRLPILLGRSLRRSPSSAPLRPVSSDPRDEEFEAGHRRDEVKSIVSDLMNQARRDE